MRTTEFVKNGSGRLVKSAQGYWAFVPNPLEPQLNFSLSLIQTLSEADRAVSELAGIARTLPNPHLLIGSFVRREAVLSSRIEGTRASFSDLLFFEAANLRVDQVPDVREVANYVKALEYGLKRLNSLPLSLRLIKEIHSLLLEGLQSEIYTPGEFRRSQNWIGPPGCTLMDATYVPPPVEEMNGALDKFEKYLHAQSQLPPLIRMALIHYQFEAIHPFLDGNGRMGRLLVTLLLCSEGILTQPLLYLSAYIEQNRNEYYHLLLKVSQTGAWSEWIAFFLNAVATQARDAIQRTDHLLDLWQRYREKMRQRKASALLLQIVDDLFAQPVITNPGITKKLSITPRSAQLNIDKLIAAGLIEEATGQRRNRVYVAQEILTIIEAQS